MRLNSKLNQDLKSTRDIDLLSSQKKRFNNL